MRVRLWLGFALGAGLGLVPACDEDRVCSPNTSAAGGLSCTAQSGECFAHNYRLDCERGTTGGDYECECFLDGISSGTCTMVDICDEGGVFFDHSSDGSAERLYVRMETCCGFDVPY
jgi:hypothetical protein